MNGRIANERKRQALDAVYLAGITRLERFIIQNEIKPAELSRASGYSRQHLLKIRLGDREPTRRCMAAILSGMQLLTHRELTVLDLFEFEDGPREATNRNPKPKRRRRRKKRSTRSRGVNAIEYAANAQIR